MHKAEVLDVYKRQIFTFIVNVSAQTVTPEPSVAPTPTIVPTSCLLYTSYPQLKADANFLDLQKTLQTIEEEIQGARRYYNGAVREFNLKLAVFPNNLIGGLLGFKNKEFFEAEESEKQNVKVDFSETETK